ncbi:MAG: hypothetical protein KC586_14010 [Myxococcales bacterium]|nr:hypothetical protein [Myxococcales bacterium]
MPDLSQLNTLAPDDALRRLAACRAAPGPVSVPDPHDLLPEVAHALGELALLRGLAHEPNVEGLDPAIRAPWDRARLLRDASLALDDDAFERAVLGWPHAHRPMSAALIERCAGHTRETVAVAALDASRAAVRAFEVRPSDAVLALRPLARHPSPLAREALARALGSFLAPAPLVALLLRDADDAVALAVCDRSHDETTLRELADDPRRTSALRIGATTRLGALGNHDTLAWLLGLPADDPRVRWGGVRRALVALHRRGVFVRDEEVDALLACFHTDEGFDATTLVRLTFTARHAFVRATETIDPADPRWIRLAPALATCEGDGARERLEGLLHALLERLAPEHLRDVLESSEIPRVWRERVTGADAFSRANEHAAEYEIAHALLLASAHAAAVSEPLLRAWVALLPEAAFVALRVHGDHRTAPALLAALDDPLAYGDARQAAIALAWRLTPSRAALAAELPPRDLRAEWLQPSIDPRLPEAVLAKLGRNATVAANLDALADVAGLDHLFSAESLFRGALLVELRLDRRPRGPDEPLDCERAVMRFGARLTSLARPFSRWAPESDRELVRVFALRWLAGEPLEGHEPEPIRDEVRVALLGMLRRVGVLASHLTALHRSWRDRSPQVRRAAIELLLEAPDAAGLELSLCHLAATAEDEPTLRQAFRAIERFEAKWAEPHARAGLDHPNMNLKRTAARALGVVGHAETVPALLGWLLRHDNAGFREDLLGALDHAAGDAATACLLEAFASAEGRARELAGAALNRRLALADVLRFVRDGRFPDLIAAAHEGTLSLRDAKPADVHAALAEEVRSPQASALPFSLEAARRMVMEPNDVRPDQLHAAIRRRATEWIAAASDDATLAPHVLRAIDATTELAAEHAAELIALVAKHGASAPRDAFRIALGLAKRAPSAHLVDALRTLPPSDAGGLGRWNALRACGAVLTRDDVRRCLRDTALAGSRATSDFLAVALGLNTDDATRALEDPTPFLDRRPKPPLATRVRTRDAAVIAEALRGPDTKMAAVAAAEVLASDDLSALRPQALKRFLDGAFSPLGAFTRGARVWMALAETLRAWPSDPARAERALTLVPHLPPHRRRAFAPAWLEAWERGEAWAARALARLPDAERYALVEARLESEPALANVSRLGAVPELARERWPDLFAPEPSRPAPEREPETLFEWEVEARTHRGRRALRAVRELESRGAIDTLDGLLLHADKTVRRAALRSLRKLAPRETYLGKAEQMLEVERDVELRRTLIRVLGHAAHALPRVADLAFDRNEKVARTARDALVAAGEPARSILVGMRRHIRPDRRATLDALLSRFP